MQDRNFSVYINVTEQKSVRQKFYFFNKSGLGQKSVGQKTLFLCKLHLGQKSAGQKYQYLYIPIRTEISRTVIKSFFDNHYQDRN